MTDLTQLSSILCDKSWTSSVTTINKIQSLASLHVTDSNKKVYSSGAYYVGKFKGNRRNGWGKLHWTLGCEHEGYYQNNKRNGQGTFTWKDGSIYKGGFKDDLRNGFGEITWPNGEVRLSNCFFLSDCNSTLYNMFFLFYTIFYI